MSACEHDFAYAGLQYRDGENQLPGSGATRTHYAHAFFCRKCCAWRHDLVGIEANSYTKRLPDSTPAPTSVDFRPEYDRRWR